MPHPPEHDRAPRGGSAGLKRLVAGALLLAATALPGAGFPALPARAGQDCPPLTLFAAASLSDVLPALLATEPKCGGRTIRTSFGPSATLARQITNGAPAHAFLSAHPRWVTQLRQGGILSQGQPLATGRLVLAAPRHARLPGDSQGGPQEGAIPLPRTLAALEPILRGRPLAMANPATAPAGAYGRRYLKAIGAWDALQGRLAYGASVRQALRLVARGGLTGLVYETDAAASPDVRILGPIPAGLSGTVRYQGGLVASGTPAARQRAAALLDWLRDGRAGEIWRSFDFHPAKLPDAPE
ncbi:molybdate ABC transporter substrate-binding protein [Yunchengibacter salinarum]|uniref:molybdate ABC transporter substrate-binding protein n=1 Tax=Yunchengibacter salinarum TaxID=3133399 RepID=UPI0035B5F8F5